MRNNMNPPVRKRNSRTDVERHTNWEILDETGIKVELRLELSGDLSQSDVGSCSRPSFFTQTLSHAWHEKHKKRKEKKHIKDDGRLEGGRLFSSLDELSPFFFHQCVEGWRKSARSRPIKEEEEELVEVCTSQTRAAREEESLELFCFLCYLVTTHNNRWWFFFQDAIGAANNTRSRYSLHEPEKQNGRV